MATLCKPEFFSLKEVLPRDFHEGYFPLYGDRLWMLFDAGILMAADALRRRYGPLECNTWHAGGQSQYRGFRPQGCAVGAPLSQHRFGRALDLVPLRVGAEEIRRDLREHFAKGKDPLDARNFITRIEDDVFWLHIDCANMIDHCIVFFKP